MLIQKYYEKSIKININLNLNIKININLKNFLIFKALIKLMEKLTENLDYKSRL